MRDLHGEYIYEKGGELWIEEQRVTDLAERYGTPLFVTSENAVRNNYRTFHHTFKSRYPGELLVCVGMKANTSLALRKVITAEGGGGDAFGMGELYVALMAGTPADRIVMNGTNKSDEVLSAALHTGAQINVDDFEELERVLEFAEAEKKTARVSLRVRLPLEALQGKMFVDPRYRPPGIDVSQWEREFKFGMEPDLFLRAVERGLHAPNIDLSGVHYHGGIPRRAGYSLEETQELMRYLGEVKNRFGWFPRTLNLGGGFPKTRVGVENPFPLERHAQGITSTVRAACEDLGVTLPRLVLEPGRWCWEDAAVYVTRAGNIKRDRKLTTKQWVYVDGSINEMGDPFDPFSGYHPAVIAHRADAEGTQTVDICGPLCNAADILAKERLMPPIERGDCIAFLSMGAYNEAFANQANAMPRSASVLVNGERHALIRRRETIQDVFSREQVPVWLL